MPEAEIYAVVASDGSRKLSGEGNHWVQEQRVIFNKSTGQSHIYHSYTYTCIHIYHTDIYIHKHIYMQAFTYTYIRTHIHTYTHIDT